MRLEDESLEVNKFLDRRQREYELFLDDVVREIKRYRDSDHFGSIYRIYTRADKQPGGAKLKSRVGISKKLKYWRENNESDKEIQVCDIHDIVGLTVVVYFSSDIERVVNHIKRNEWTTFNVVSHEKKEDVRGYFADHIVVGRRNFYNSIFRPLCEIQIKTLLHDGWATKTHDLTYKSRVKIDPDVDELMSLLGKNIQNLEEQSDALRRKILNVEENDKARRRAAAVQLAYTMTQAGAPDIDPFLVDLGKKIIANKDHLRDCRVGDPLLAEIVEDWRVSLDNGGFSRSLCRCIVLLATIRLSGDFDHDAIEAIELWVKAEEHGEAKHGAISFSALAHWVLGHFDGAVMDARAALDYAAKHKLDAKNGHMNLAYYWAEKIFSEGQEGFNEDLKEIQTLVAASRKPVNDRESWSHEDTIGAIEIMCATNSKAVLQGLNKCENALALATQANEDTELFRAFFELHQQRALQRLNEFSSKSK